MATQQQLQARLQRIQQLAQQRSEAVKRRDAEARERLSRELEKAREEYDRLVATSAPTQEERVRAARRIVRETARRASQPPPQAPAPREAGLDDLRFPEIPKEVREQLERAGVEAPPTPPGVERAERIRQAAAEMERSGDVRAARDLREQAEVLEARIAGVDVGSVRAAQAERRRVQPAHAQFRSETDPEKIADFDVALAVKDHGGDVLAAIRSGRITQEQARKAGLIAVPANAVLLNTGEFVSRETWDSLTKQQQNALKVQGVEAFNAQQAFAQRFRLGETVLLDTGERVKREDFLRLTPEQQRELQRVGIAAFNLTHTPKPVLTQQEIDALLDAEIARRGLDLGVGATRRVRRENLRRQVAADLGIPRNAPPTATQQAINEALIGLIPVVGTAAGALKLADDWQELSPTQRVVQGSLLALSAAADLFLIGKGINAGIKAVRGGKIVTELAVDKAEDAVDIARAAARVPKAGKIVALDIQAADDAAQAAAAARATREIVQTGAVRATTEPVAVIRTGIAGTEAQRGIRTLEAVNDALKGIKVKPLAGSAAPLRAPNAKAAIQFDVTGKVNMADAERVRRALVDGGVQSVRISYRADSLKDDAKLLADVLTGRKVAPNARGRLIQGVKVSKVIDESPAPLPRRVRTIERRISIQPDKGRPGQAVPVGVGGRGRPVPIVGSGSRITSRGVRVRTSLPPAITPARTLALPVEDADFQPVMPTQPGRFTPIEPVTRATTGPSIRPGRITGQRVGAGTAAAASIGIGTGTGATVESGSETGTAVEPSAGSRVSQAVRARNAGSTATRAVRPMRASATAGTGFRLPSGESLPAGVFPERATWKQGFQRVVFDFRTGKADFSLTRDSGEPDKTFRVLSTMSTKPNVRRLPLGAFIVLLGEDGLEFQPRRVLRRRLLRRTPTRRNFRR